MSARKNEKEKCAYENYGMIWNEQPLKCSSPHNQKLAAPPPPPPQLSKPHSATGGIRSFSPLLSGIMRFYILPHCNSQRHLLRPPPLHLNSHRRFLALEFPKCSRFLLPPFFSWFWSQPRRSWPARQDYWGMLKLVAYAMI